MRSTHAALSRERTYSEEEYNKNGAATFQFLNGSGPGQPLEFQEIVMVSPKIRNTTLPSTMPDGYWYRIASVRSGASIAQACRYCGVTTSASSPSTDTSENRHQAHQARPIT